MKETKREIKIESEKKKDKEKNRSFCLTLVWLK